MKSPRRTSLNLESPTASYPDDVSYAPASRKLLGSPNSVRCVAGTSSSISVLPPAVSSNSGGTGPSTSYDESQDFLHALAESREDDSTSSSEVQLFLPQDLQSGSVDLRPDISEDLQRLELDDRPATPYPSVSASHYIHRKPPLIAWILGVLGLASVLLYLIVFPTKSHRTNLLDQLEV